MFGMLSKLWKGIKFAASATIGIPCALAATAVVGSAYLLAEATNIVEAKVFHPYGIRLVHKNPFFEGVSTSLYGTLSSIWRDYGVYAHITIAGAALQKMRRYGDYRERTEITEIAEKNDMEVEPEIKEQKDVKIEQPSETKDQTLLSQNSETNSAKDTNDKTKIDNIIDDKKTSDNKEQQEKSEKKLENQDSQILEDKTKLPITTKVDEKNEVKMPNKEVKTQDFQSLEDKTKSAVK